MNTSTMTRRELRELEADLIPILKAIRLSIELADSGRRDPDGWTDTQFNDVKFRLGPTWGHVPVEQIRIVSARLRKRGALGPVTPNGHGKPKGPVLSEEHKQACKAMRDDGRFDEVCRLFEFRCAICDNMAHLEPHHRHYRTLGVEEFPDFIPVCRDCHKVADKRRQMVAKRHSQ